jgi:hypothetical protein
VSITSESYWGREANPPALVTLGAKLRAHYEISAGAIGIKGNTAHLDGYHRSANWVHNSAFCDSRSYSVTETPGNRKPTNADWCCAMDVTLPHDELLAACKRLDTAVRAGHLEKITEWYGNDDGDNRVDGYDNIHNAVASSDSSHLWHLHMSFDRGRVGEDHTDVYEILTGDDMPTTPADAKLIVDTWIKYTMSSAELDIQNKALGNWLKDGEAAQRQSVANAAAIAALATKVDQILAALAGGGTLPPAGDNTSATFTGTVEFKPVTPPTP